MSDPKKDERFHFDRYANMYDSARPGYPSLLFEDLICLAQLPPTASVLDIGCGTGKSTEPFARKGYRVCALDPGAQMLALCRRNLHAYTNVRYELGSFEAWDWSGAPFDLIVSGTAFHWVPESAHPRLTALLRPGGTLAIFWNTFLNGQAPIFDTIEHLYLEHSPEIHVADFAGAQELFDLRREQQMLSLPGLSRWRTLRYYEEMICDAKRYTDLMRTWSTHRNVKEILFEEVRTAILAAGDKIVKPVRTTLCLGRKDLP